MDGSQGLGEVKARRLEQRDRAQLRELTLFATLLEREMDEVVHLSSWRRYDEGEQIAPPRQEHDVAYIVVEGRVQLCRLSQEGRSFIEYWVECGGYFDFWGGARDDEVVAEAIVEGTIVCSLPWPVFPRVVKSNADAAAVVIEQERSMRHEMEAISGDAVLHNVSTQVRHVLRRMALERADHSVPYKIEDIARMAGTSVRQASRVIADLLRQGLIVRRKQRGPIVVRNPDDLL